MDQLCRDYNGEWIAWHQEAQAKEHMKTLPQEAIALIQLDQTTREFCSIVLDQTIVVFHILFIFKL